ncbi:16S rRNA (guanine(527)-N(7))-methyltransferase RsmG [Qipengyuania sp. CAU 1752]
MIETEQQARAFVAERCDARALDRLDQLVEALQEENSRQNLVSAKSLAQVWVRHIADSAQLLDHVPRGTGPWLDMGSGAGFPGLVLAIMQPECEITLVESRKRRIEWLEQTSLELDLPNCSIQGMRLEQMNPLLARVITARAFAPLEKLLKLSARFSTADTLWLLPKGRSGGVELQSLVPKWRKMFHVEQSQTDAEAVILVGQGAIEGKGAS